MRTDYPQLVFVYCTVKKITKFLDYGSLAGDVIAYYCSCMWHSVDCGVAH